MDTQANTSLETVLVNALVQVLPQVLSETLKAYETAYSEPKQVTAKQAYANANKRDIAKNKATQDKVCKQNKPRKHYETKVLTAAQARKAFDLEYIGNPPICLQVGTHLWLQWKNKPTDKVRNSLKSQGFRYHEKRFGEHEGEMFWHLAR